jgi:arsenate reductase-like glutaredoxin family protein
MTDKQLKKLKKDELLEVLIYMRQEIDNLTQENESLKRQLEERSKVNFSQEDVSNIMEAVKKVLSSN